MFCFIFRCSVNNIAPVWLWEHRLAFLVSDGCSGDPHPTSSFDSTSMILGMSLFDQSASAKGVLVPFSHLKTCCGDCGYILLTQITFRFCFILWITFDSWNILLEVKFQDFYSLTRRKIISTLHSTWKHGHQQRVAPVSSVEFVFLSLSTVISLPTMGLK